MSASQGAWECRHDVDGRDHCPECHAPPECGASFRDHLGMAVCCTLRKGHHGSHVDEYAAGLKERTYQ